MGHEKKTGKGRLDKYYKLAKEQGYRARSAFKLIQLNKKYSFLESARCTIDLCAAPGGWLQVASKYMPANSIIVGVDLVPIRPIPRVVTFAADITTPQCRTLIRGELKDWKADVVLHDGAPNVGTAWIQDAYTQSELVLMSLKLAVEFLAKGGTFVTKVFRSVDYNNLIWVFNQLFGKVEATKPPSSRNVSAEIFVVCRDFLAPKLIDPKFLDPKHVFKDLSTTLATGEITAGNAESNVFHPEKKRRHRDGYADGDYTLFKAIPASTFIMGSDPISVLGSANKITFLTDEEKEWYKLDVTTGDVKANCDDLKVLGKGDFKTLIKWRLALREELGLDNKAKDTEDATEQVEVVEVVDEEQQISEELERLNAEAAARAKRERRRANEIKTKTIQRMQLQMTAPLDIGLEQHDAMLGIGQDDIFDLEHTDGLSRNRKKTTLAMDDNGDAIMDSSDEEKEDEDDTQDVFDSEEEREKKVAELEAELDGLYDIYQGRLRERDTKYKVKEARRKNAEREEWKGIKANGSDSEISDEEDAGGWDKVQAAKLDAGSSESGDSSDEEDEDDVPEVAGRMKRSRSDADVAPKGTKRQRFASQPGPPTASATTSAAAQLWFSQDVFAGVDGLDKLSDSEQSEPEEDEDEDESSKDDEEHVASSDEDDDSDDFEVVPQEEDEDVDLWDGEGEDEDLKVKAGLQKYGLMTPEAVTLAQQLVNRQKTKTQLINEGFNRYSLNSKEDLPSWFLDDEAKNYKLNIPVTKEAMAALRAKQRALDARPIKKVAEAKARKKFKAAQRLEKAMKKAEGVNATADMSEKEKAQQIDKLMRKGISAAKKAKKEIKVVVAKGAHKGLKGRPKGVKGRYTMVDSRMKKEVRAKKRKEKATRKR
ncbi:AdoMet-dependent rRNA methyltransferase SPB1 [Psilocybe cubensis]|uniref:AdoMet-dependent rRNA methyltransferase SPB1 n=2 Tax=Psilocybe cubensis TaxID=181762 RepID=A0A8H7YAC1_PSICU|nr:AdoMet-dependent rRNA methyltransferase SPB1 [Psilocybe cubensis]KAH9486823.1 AdoMet-dependent rRNA methyltransferase SPB1 [Psilocybe cubensis]